MWGSLKTILSQYYTYDHEESEKKTADDIDGWVFVDKSGREVEKETVEIEAVLDNPTKLDESRLNPLPLLDISNTSSAQSSPQLSPTKIEEGWLVAPPPCFTLNCPSNLEISPLEDLLIEHPSMSVYGQIPNMNLQETKVENKKLMPAHSKVEVEPCREENRNDVMKTGAKSEATKSHYDLAGLFNQVENMKPAQQAKWENEQYKLCPSYMTRQNRVHRYQSRKHHNQKKKSLGKPFAEKGRHNF